MENEMKDEEQVLIDALNEQSKNAGTMAFKIKYTAIPSNRKTHKDFAEFCFKEANNNYLSGLNILLKYAKIFEWLDRIEDRLTQSEYNLAMLRDMLVAKETEDENDKEEISEKRKPKLY